MDPRYRGLGLGTVLVNDFIRIARHDGLRHLTCMLVADFEADASIPSPAWASRAISSRATAPIPTATSTTWSRWC